MPETFLPSCDVEFTMPMATVSNTVVRSVGVEQHADSERVEKFVRYVAKYQHKVDIDYVQCNNLDNDLSGDQAALDTTINDDKRHVAAFNPDDVQANHEGYGISAAHRKLSGGMDDNSWQFSGSAGHTSGPVVSGSEFLGNSRNKDSSSDDDDDTPKKMPIIEINMKGYGY